MKAREYLTEVRMAYSNLRGMRERLRAEPGVGKQKALRTVLRSEALCYSDTLNDVWDTVEQVEPQVCQDILLHRYIFLETWEQIAAEMKCCISTLYKHHARGIAKVQRILDARNRR